MGVTFHGLAVAAVAAVSALAPAAAAAALTADSQAAAAQWRPGHADAVAGGLPVLAGTQHSVAAGGSLAAHMADDAVAFRKLLHGCHAGECLRKCPVCTFFGDAAVGHCKKKGDLFRCQHTEPDGIDGNEGNEGDEGSEGDEGNEGNEGNTGGVGSGAANALTAQKLQRSVPLPTALPGGGFADSSSADGTYARGYDDFRSETYFREFEGFSIEAGSHIEVDYEHSMGKVAPPEDDSAPEDWPLATGDHAGRRMLGLSNAGVDADGAEVPPEAEEQMYYLDDGSVVEWGPYIHVSYDNPQPFPDNNAADYDP